MLDNVLLIFGSAAVTAFLQWLLYIRKHKAEANSVEKTNDATEIENLVNMAKEWRETAQSWKSLADETQKELILCKKSEQSTAEKLEALERKVKLLNSKLTRAYKRIEELEGNDGNK